MTTCDGVKSINPGLAVLEIYTNIINTLFKVYHLASPSQSCILQDEILLITKYFVFVLSCFIPIFNVILYLFCICFVLILYILYLFFVSYRFDKSCI